MATATITDSETPIRIPPSAATLEGFREWATSDAFPERGRISFLDGEVVIDMAAEAYGKHNAPKTEITRVVEGLNREFDLGRFFGDRTLLTSRSAGLSTEPDGMFVTWKSFESGRVTLVPSKADPDDFIEVQGTPDWVMEIVSRHYAAKDVDDLRQAYHRARIPEYWLINALDDAIDFQILVHQPEDYVPVESQGGWFASSLFGRSFRLTRERDRMGLWRYTLDVK